MEINSIMEPNKQTKTWKTDYSGQGLNANKKETRPPSLLRCSACDGVDIVTVKFSQHFQFE